MAETPPLEPLTVSIQEAGRLSGLSEKTLHRRIKAGRLVSHKDGERRLISYQSLKAMVLPPAQEPAQ